MASIAGGIGLLTTAPFLADLWSRLRGRGDTPISALVEAVGHERYGEARLTGGFEYVEWDATRGRRPLAVENVRLLAAAARLQERVTADPTPEHVHAWGVAQTLLGDPRAAIESLNRAGQHPSRAVANVDLAAAYLARAAVEGSASDAALAVRALGAVPPATAEPEWLFNRALAFEALGNHDLANAAWAAAARRERDPGWRADIERRMAALAARRPPASSAARSPALPADVLAKAIAAAGCLRAAHDCQVELRDLRRAADASGDDRLPAAVSSFLQTLTPGDRRAAEAVALLQGMQAADDDDRVTARRLLQQVPLHASHPLKVLVEVYGLVAASDDAAFPSRLDVLEARAEAAERSGWVRLAAVAFNWAALGQARASRLDAALADRLRALRLYESVDDPALVAELHALVAEHYRLVSAWDEAWTHHRQSFRFLDRTGARRSRHVVYAHAALTALAMDDLALASVLQDALLDNATAWGFPAAIVAAAAQRARTYVRAHAPSDALAAIGAARAALERMPPSDYTQRVAAELIETEAEARVADGGIDAVAAVQSAVNAFTRAGYEYRLVGARTLLAEALAAGGRMEAAGQASREALRAWAGAVDGLPADDLGQATEASLQRLGRQLADVALARGDAVALAEAVDVARARHFDAGAFARARQLTPPGHCALVFVDTTRGSVAAGVYSADSDTVAELALSDTDIRHIVWTYRAAVQRDPFTPSRAAMDAGRRLTTPIERSLASCTTLSIVPTDGLAGLPFAALRSDDGRPWGQRLTVAINSTATGAVRGWLHDPSQAPRRVWVLGSAGPGEMPALPAVPAELDAISRMYASPVTVTTPTAESFRRAFQDADVLHFAGHAVADVRQASQSYVQLAGSPGRYRLSQLVSTGTAPRVVVLAACQTAFTATEQSGAVLGLARVALEAGAQFVVGSLWDVGDADAAAFSALLHEQLARGLNAPEALRRAQLNAAASGSGAHAAMAFIAAGPRP